MTADAGRSQTPDEAVEAAVVRREPHCEDDIYGPCGCPDEEDQ